METALINEEKWNVLNNSSAFIVYYQGTLWATVEHAYLASKFTKEFIIEEIKKARSPLKAKEISLKYKKYIRNDWNEIKIFKMEELLRAKLDQHPEIKKILIESIDLKIVYNNESNYWGHGKNRKGQNMLGKLWMKLRHQLPIFANQKQKTIIF